MDEQTVPRVGDNATGLEREVWNALYGVEDPEMPISIVDLGLIYDLTVEDGAVKIDMTLTYTGCPAREFLLDDIKEAVEAVEGVSEVKIDIRWTPEWTIEMITDEGRQSLKDFGLEVPK